MLASETIVANRNTAAIRTTPIVALNQHSFLQQQPGVLPPRLRRPRRRCLQPRPRHHLQHQTMYHQAQTIKGVGVGVAVTLAVIVTAALFWRRHRRRRGHQSVLSSSPADSNPQFRPPVQERGLAKYSDDIDARATAIRAYELESMKRPSEIHGSEPETKDLNTFTPRILRPSSVNKLD
jgi:hypothetical protein